jgi:integrase
MPKLTPAFVRQLAAGPRLVAVADDGAPGLELYVTPAGAKTFSVRYRLQDGTRRRYNLGRWPALTLSAARSEALITMGRVARGEDPTLDRRRVRQSRIGESRDLDTLAEALFEASALGGVRASTLGYWRWLYGRHIQPALGRRRVQDLAIPDARRALRAIGAAAGPATANRAHGLLRRLLNFAVEEGRLTSNPLTRMKPLFRETSRARVLSHEELAAVWAAAESAREADGGPKGVSRSMAIALQLCLLTLQRGGEVVGMRAQELDLAEGLWLIPAGRTKASREHLVPLSDEAIRLIGAALDLAALRLGRTPSGPDPVFPSPRDPAQPIVRLSLTRAAARLMAFAGVVDATPHDLRRTAATSMASERLGVPTDIIARVLNHATPGAATTMIYNRHAYAREKRDALQRWAKFVQMEVARANTPASENVRRLTW